jgi:hypothetical protein
VDVALGMSFVARQLKFQDNLAPGLNPPGYKQTVPVAGALIDATIYPLAFGHKSKDITKNIGVNAFVDQVIHINSQVNNIDGSTVKLQTTESHFAVGATFRYPINGSMLFTGIARYGKQSFTIAHPPGVNVDMPSVSYSMIEPGARLSFVLSPKLTALVGASALIVLSAGDISSDAEYGKGSALGVQGEVGGEYVLTKNVFARISGRVESIGMKFNGTGMKTFNRDGDNSSIDVQGARDTYFGATATVGYLY